MQKILLILGLLLLIPLRVSKSNKTIIITEPSRVDIKLLARLLESECSICPVSEKKLVGATVLNRIGHSDFPDDLKSVINQKNQYYITDQKPSKESFIIARDLLNCGKRNQKILYFYKPGNGFKRKNVMYKTKYHHYAT